jgi:hypothetical protein
VAGNIGRALIDNHELFPYNNYAACEGGFMPFFSFLPLSRRVRPASCITRHPSFPTPIQRIFQSNCDKNQEMSFFPLWRRKGIT